MTGVLGGLLAALMWGTSTAIASRSTRMIGSQQVLAYVMLTGLVIMAVAAPVVEGVPDVTGRGAAWALAAGRRLGGRPWLRVSRPCGSARSAWWRRSPPCEGALAAVFSVILLGEQLSLGVALALAVVACGVVLVTFHAQPVRPAPAPGAAGGLVGGRVRLRAGGELAGGRGDRPVLDDPGVARGGRGVRGGAAGRCRGSCGCRGRALPLVVYSGFAEVTGFVGYITGAQHGVAVPAVLASQFAAVAAFISFLFFGERLSRMQVCGAVLIGTGVATVAVLRA